MNETELVDLAIENMEEAFRYLRALARSDKHLNIDHKDIKDGLNNIETKLRLVFTLKNAFNQLQRK